MRGKYIYIYLLGWANPSQLAMREQRDSPNIHHRRISITGKSIPVVFYRWFPSGLGTGLTWISWIISLLLLGNERTTRLSYIYLHHRFASHIHHRIISLLLLGNERTTRLPQNIYLPLIYIYLPLIYIFASQICLSYPSQANPPHRSASYIRQQYISRRILQCTPNPLSGKSPSGLGTGLTWISWIISLLLLGNERTTRLPNERTTRLSYIYLHHRFASHIHHRIISLILLGNERTTRLPQNIYLPLIYIYLPLIYIFASHICLSYPSQANPPHRSASYIRQQYISRRILQCTPNPLSGKSPSGLGTGLTWISWIISLLLLGNERTTRLPNEI